MGNEEITFISHFSQIVWNYEYSQKRFLQIKLECFRMAVGLKKRICLFEIYELLVRRQSKVWSPNAQNLFTAWSAIFSRIS